MKRRVKRRLFLMSVALASGATGPVFARDAALPHFDAHAHASDAYRPLHAGANRAARGDDARSWFQFAGLKQRIPGILHAVADTHAGSSDTKGWRLGLMAPEPASAHDQDARLNQGMRLGLALRAAF